MWMWNWNSSKNKLAKYKSGVYSGDIYVKAFIVICDTIEKDVPKLPPTHLELIAKSQSMTHVLLFWRRMTAEIASVARDGTLTRD